jgi:hypothetical protein
VRPTPVDSYPDQVPRLERFRAEHPEWVIALDGFWRARRADADTWAVTRYELRVLLDELDRITGNGTTPLPSAC